MSQRPTPGQSHFQPRVSFHLRQFAPIRREHFVTATGNRSWYPSARRGKETIRSTDFQTGVRYMAFTEAAPESRVEGRTVAVG